MLLFNDLSDVRDRLPESKAAGYFFSRSDNQAPKKTIKKESTAPIIDSLAEK
jgi:hypothetical protein